MELEDSITRGYRKDKTQFEPFLPRCLTKFLKKVKKEFKPLIIGVGTAYILTNLAASIGVFQVLKDGHTTVESLRENGVFVYDESKKHSKLSEQFGREVAKPLMSCMNAYFKPGTELGCLAYEKLDKEK